MSLDTMSWLTIANEGDAIAAQTLAIRIARQKILAQIGLIIIFAIYIIPMIYLCFLTRRYNLLATTLFTLAHLFIACIIQLIIDLHVRRFTEKIAEKRRQQHKDELNKRIKEMRLRLSTLRAIAAENEAALNMKTRKTQ